MRLWARLAADEESLQALAERVRLLEQAVREIVDLLQRGDS
jgi:hypothetical protein